MATETFDYVIVGGGTVGCVLACKLSRANHRVVVLEAGPEDYSDPVMTPAAAPTLFGGPLQWSYKTTPQPHLANREIPQYGGRLLSGSSGVNLGNWTRTHSADYDEWAARVGDNRWSYQGMLPYFKKIETHYDRKADPQVHGIDGPIHTATTESRAYPLRETVKESLIQGGLEYIPDINTGNPLGFGPFTENWRDNRRQPASKAYSLSDSNATVRTNTSVSRVVVDPSTKVATGVELENGNIINASREVLVCTGSIQTPKLLMLSGIGPAAHLSSHGIPVLQDLPVGENLHDHIGGSLYWKLKNPEKGLTAGHPEFNKPEYFAGNPIDWLGTCPIDNAAEVARKYGIPADDKLLSGPRAHLEMFVIYAPISAPWVFDNITDVLGTHIATPILTTLPRSRGRITLASKDPATPPIIDPQYLAEPMDREAFRTGFRRMMRTMLETPAGQSMVSEETPPPGMKQLTSAASDADIDARLERIALSFFQIAGTAAMGAVVDTELRVKGVQRLRVADASVIPVPLAGHYQCPVYALAEAAADIVLAAA